MVWFGVVGIHTAGVSVHFREGGGPACAVLIGHSEERGKDGFLHGTVHHNAERMSGPIGVPNPVVIIKGNPLIFMYLIVKRTPVAPVFAHADGTLESAVIRGVKYRLLLLGSAFKRHAAQFFVPKLTACGCHLFYIVGVRFPAEISKGLLRADERYAVAEMNLLLPEAEGDTGVPSLVAFPLRNLPMSQGAGQGGCLLKLHGHIHAGLP